MSKFGKRLAKEVNRLAAESPDFIYPHEDAVYVLNGEPSCLYGQALWNLGLIDESFERKLGKTQSGLDGLLNYQPIDIVLDRLNLKVGKKEVMAFILSQESQDNGRPWDVSVRPLEAIS